jgi:membrane protein
MRSPAKVWPGALVAALMFQVLSIGFSIYIESFGSYNLVFGALGAVAVFLFWVYLNASVMIFGAEVAAEYPRMRAGEQAGMPGVSEPLTQQGWRTVRGLFVRSGPTAPQDSDGTAGEDDH